MVEYDYSIANDFPNHAMSSDRLTAEIRSSSIVTALDRIDTVSDVCSIWFKSDLSQTDKDTLDALVAAHSGAPIVEPPSHVTIFGTVGEAKQNSDGIMQMSGEPRIGTEVIYGTHNFADKTTWASDSVRVVDEIAIDSGDGLTFNLVNKYLIDIIHGKVFDEDQYVRDQQSSNPSDPHGYAIIVTVDNAAVTIREALEVSGGDCEVNYTDGKIVFFQSQSGKTVKVSYSYATTSNFYISPDAGFDLDIEKAKAMWSADFDMTDSVRFEIYGFAAVFAPQLGLPSGTKIPLSVTEYRTLNQLTSEASEYQPHAIPASGGTTRGTTQDRHATYFRYGTIRRLTSAAGIELRICTGHNRVMGGEFATATFYCVVKPETV
jgi:hypothetical protein